jgi:hypothetical protein
MKEEIMMRPLIIAAALAAAFALPAAAEKGTNQALTAQDAKGWTGKPVFSSDGKELGKVTRLDSGADNKATQLRADIGAATGAGQHPVILPATRFSLERDRIVLDMPASQASKLPKMNY